MEVVIKILKGEVEIARQSIASPVTAAEAKDGVRDMNAAWVGNLTNSGSSVGLVGQCQLAPGGTYRLHLHEQAGVIEDMLAHAVKEGILLALNELLDNKDLLPRLARHLKDIMNDISGTASRVGSTEMKTILERLQFTVLCSLELPCCLAGADFDGEVAAYRWKKGEAHPTEEAVTLMGSKTHYLFMPTTIVQLCLPQPPRQPAWGHLLGVLRHVLAIYEAKTSKHVEAQGVKSVWPQAVAQALVLDHMMEFDAGVERRVPVFAADLNEHMIVHYADKKTLYVATSSEAEDGKRVAVGCMRQLLSTALGTPEAALADEEMVDPDEPGPSGAGDGPHRGGSNEQRPPGSADEPPTGGRGGAGMQLRSGRRTLGPGADTATSCDQGGSGGRVSADTESLYHEALLKLLASSDGYDAIGLPGPPHTIRHNTAAEWLAGMEVLHICH